jgi:hypothetical protein
MLDPIRTHVKGKEISRAVELVPKSERLLAPPVIPRVTHAVSARLLYLPCLMWEKDNKGVFEDKGGCVRIRIQSENSRHSTRSIYV